MPKKVQIFSFFIFNCILFNGGSVMLTLLIDASLLVV